MDDTATIRRATAGVVEAAWLVALVSLPLYFTVLTPEGYEPDKAVLLRVLAIVAATAWLAGWLAGDRTATRQPSQRLLLGAGVALFAAYCVATVLSIDPRLSLWGSEPRQEGLWTHAAYLVFFVCIATRLRTKGQLRRLVTAALLSSIPVVGYGLLEGFGWDPIISSGDPSQLAFRVHSSLGQHIFLGSFLVMVMPFTAARLLEGWNDRDGDADRKTQSASVIGASLLAGVALSFIGFVALAAHFSALFALFPAVLGGYAALVPILDQLERTAIARRGKLLAYGLLLAGQLGVLALSGARGAWLGALASAPIFGIMWARRINRPRFSAGMVAATLGAGIFLTLLNVPGGPLQPIRNVRALNRVANITDSGGAGGSAGGRKLIWQGIGQLMTSDPAIGNTWAGVGRDVVGYGPETLHWAFEAVYPLRLRQVTSEIWTWDRAHDIYLDYLVDGGLLALLAFLAVIVLVLWRIAKMLPVADGPSAWILIAAASALAGHLVDGLFGLETPVTLLLLWVLAGIAVVMRPDWDLEADHPVAMPAPGVASAWVGITLVFAAVVVVLDPTRHPAWLAGILIASALIGVAAVSDVLGGPRPRWASGLRTRRSALLISVAVLLTAALALGSQQRFETAAMAAREAGKFGGQGQVATQIGYFQEAASNDGYEPQYETDLGGAYLNLGAGRAASSEPLTLFPSNAYRDLGSTALAALNRGDSFELGQQALQAAIDLAPLNPQSYSDLGNLYLASGRASDALYAFQEAEQLSRDNPKYVNQEALAELQAGHLREGARLAQQALSLDSTYWYSHYTLALASNAVGNVPQAQLEANSALGWMKNYWPPPPAGEVAELRSLARSG